MKQIYLLRAFEYAKVLCPLLPTKVRALGLGKLPHYILLENLKACLSRFAKTLSSHNGNSYYIYNNKLIQDTMHYAIVLSLSTELKQFKPKTI